MITKPTVAVVTLGCARNDVDSEELAARLEAADWRVVAGADARADVVVVNTCGFVAAAKQESIDTLLAASSEGAPVVAVGCLAERYGRELADELPEATAVLGFDAYPDLGETLHRVVAGERIAAHEPVDRRTLLPLTPVRRVGGARPPGHATGGTSPALHLPADQGVLRRRLAGGPTAPLKIASGCDRRCAFCAIPRFRGAFLSRPAAEILAEARWLAGQGVRELLMVSENSTSYGKDLGDPRALEPLLADLAAVPGIARVRVSYLQPAEVRAGLVTTIAATPGVAPYFDLSFQHASGPLLRRMRRFGDAESFLALVADIRERAPQAGIRSNVIVGFPGETEWDLALLEDFLARAELDAVGVFGYSAEDGTEAAGFADTVDRDEIADRVARVSDLAEIVSSGRAADRAGTVTQVLVESVAGGVATGRADFQGPEDGETTLPSAGLSVGDLVSVTISGADGVDLRARQVTEARR